MSVSNQPSVSPGLRRRNQVILVVLWLVPFGLMAIAGIVYYMVESGQIALGSKNNGVLIRPPIQMSDLMSDKPLESGSVTNEEVQSVFDGKWTMVIRGDSVCDQPCRDALYITRQLHIRLDKNANRVQRVYLYDALDSSETEKLAPREDAGLSKELATFFESEHRLLSPVGVAKATMQPIDQQLVSVDGEKATFFIVDPQGWAMMYYLPQHEGNAILTDLKHLLKFSRER